MLMSAKMSVQSSDVYISAAFNRITHIADWANTPSSTVAFASHKSIALWSHPGHRHLSRITQIIQTGFPKSISCLKFHAPTDSSQCPSIVAGSADGSIAIWTLDPINSNNNNNNSKDDPINNNKKWSRAVLVSSAHTASVSAIGVIRPNSGYHGVPFLVTGATDGLVKVWQLTNATETCPAQLKLLQTIDLKGRFPLDIALIQLTTSAELPSPILLALSTTTKNIDLYALDASHSTLHFSHKLSLEGHEDWVKSLDFCNTRVSLENHDHALMLASGSQDGSVRLWKIATASESSSSSSIVTASSPTLKLSEADEFERMASKIQGDSMSNGELSTRPHRFDIQHTSSQTIKWSVTFDALLVGHDSWVTGVRWHPALATNQTTQPFEQPAALLSSSADNSLILWTPSGTHRTLSPFPPFTQALLSTGGAKRARGPTAHHLASSIWLPSQRFGEVGGASNLGFFGALWKPPSTGNDGFEAVLAHGWGGSAHISTLETTAAAADDSQTQTANRNHNHTLVPQWQVATPVTGHFGPAKGVAWEPCGEYFLSCSVDQTTRLHAMPNALSHPHPHPPIWNEIARPQSHGYDLQSVTWLDRLNFVSAADEKVLRVFSAPRGFVGTVSPKGLNCVSIGTEDQSRKALRGSKVNSTLVVLHVDQQNGLFASAARHGDLVRQSAEASLLTSESNLTVFVSSALFDNLQASKSALTFKQIEGYLKWLYAQAWSVAISKHCLLAEVNVLLVPSNKTAQVVKTFQPHSSRILVDRLGVSFFQPIFDNLGIQAIQIDSEIQLTAAQDFASLGLVDDDRGLQLYRVVALGGTFDHLHVGHKILLSMASLIATEKIIVGVTNDAMLAKKSNPHLLESIDDRINSVNGFIRLFRLPFSALEQQVVPLLDVAGPAGTEADIQALVVTEETLSGADFIQNKRNQNSLGSLDHWTIGVLGSHGEVGLKGDAKTLADSKIGSTAIRKWLSSLGQRYAFAHNTLLRQRREFIQTFTENQDDVIEMIESRPVGASVPPLGLSNRAVYEGIKIEQGPSESGQPIGESRESLAAVLYNAPTEEQLGVETLWPELDKLYGHGYELLWLSANPGGNSKQDDGGGGRFVASCCRATDQEHAVVRVHDRLRNWKECSVLKGHTLSITRIRWSIDSRFILSCSRDRSWRLFEKKIFQDDVSFVPFTGEIFHSRIIWDAAWSNDPTTPYLFATASRDKTVKIFQLQFSNTNTDHDNDRPFELLETLSFKEPITAITFGIGQLLAIGKESGGVEIYSSHQQQQGKIWSLVFSIPDMASEQINQLEFRPPVLEDENDAILVSASEDGVVRVVRLKGIV